MQSASGSGSAQLRQASVQPEWTTRHARVPVEGPRRVTLVRLAGLALTVDGSRYPDRRRGLWHPDDGDGQSDLIERIAGSTLCYRSWPDRRRGSDISFFRLRVLQWSSMSTVYAATRPQLDVVAFRTGIMFDCHGGRINNIDALVRVYASNLCALVGAFSGNTDI